MLCVGLDARSKRQGGYSGGNILLFVFNVLSPLKLTTVLKERVNRGPGFYVQSPAKIVRNPFFNSA